MKEVTFIRRNFEGEINIFPTMKKKSDQLLKKFVPLIPPSDFFLHFEFLSFWVEKKVSIQLYAKHFEHVQR